MAVLNASPAVVFDGARRLSLGRPVVVVPRNVLLALALTASFVVTLWVSMAMARPTAVPEVTPRPVAVVAETSAYPAYTVTAGDTLWSIAERTRPGVDPRAVILQVRTLNNLSPSHVLQAGEVLQLPTG